MTIHISTAHSTVFYTERPPCETDYVSSTADGCYYCGAKPSEKCKAVYEPQRRETGDNK